MHWWDRTKLWSIRAAMLATRSGGGLHSSINEGDEGEGGEGGEGYYH
jgi:hypothetical protein